MLIYSASGTKDKAHGAQKARHIMQIGELLSTAQRRISPAQPINQCFLRRYEYFDGLIKATFTTYKLMKTPSSFYLLNILRHFISATLLSSFALMAHAMQPFVIKDIRVEGVQRIEAGSVFTYLPVKVGDRMNDSKASEAIKALYATGFFKDVVLEDVGNGVLLVSLEERPAIASVDFVGLEEFDKTQLLKALKSTGIAEARIFDRSLLEKAEQELKHQYLSRGKYATTIATTVTPLERNRVGIQFSIDEGDAARIKEINIVGANDFDVDDLIGDFELQTTGMWSWYSKNDRYSKQKLVADEEKLRSFYLDRGYLEFKINSTQVAISSDRRDVFITINITEGKPYKISSVKLAGNLPLDRSEFEKMITVEPGSVFSRERMNESTKAMSERLGKEGFAFANVNAVPEIDKEKREASFTIYIDPGKRVYVRRINVTGNTKTADEVIRREVRQMESGLYDAGRVALSKQRIDKLGFFQDVNIDTQPVPGTSDQVDVNVNVAEKPTGNLSLGVGYSSTEKVLISGSFQQANAFGTGKTVGISLNTGKTNRTASLSYTDPYFTIDGISQGFDIYYRTYDPTALSISSYRTRSAGAGLRWRFPISEHQSIGMAASFDRTEITTFDNSPQRYLRFVEEHGAANNTVPLTLSWRSDKRNSSIYPTSGATHYASIEAATPAGSLKYYRAGYSFTQYLPVSDAFTLSLNATGNYGKGYGGQTLPFYKHFYAGGIGSVRGYAYGGIGPREYVCDDYQTETGCRLTDTHVGGDRRLHGSAELLYGFPGYEKYVRMGLFYDFGQSFGEDEPFSFAETKRSAGVSLSWISPIGPLSFSWARALNAEDGDRKQPFQFQVGATF